MKTLSVVFYCIGAILLIISCFTASVAATWWLGGIAVAALIVGCVFQFNATKNNDFAHHH